MPKCVHFLGRTLYGESATAVRADGGLESGVGVRGGATAHGHALAAGSGDFGFRNHYGTTSTD